jgi:PKD repeat protein
MKTIFTASAVILLLAVFSISCTKKESTNPAPIANFTYSSASSTAPATFIFSNTSTDATAFVWEFGDNTTSTDQNPQHTYIAGGAFTVKLTAIGQGGTNSTTKTINIQNPVGPTADFSFTGAGGAAPCLIHFENHCTNATSFVWDFGDGQSSVASNPSHTYTSGGNFNVRLTATGVTGSNSISKSVFINSPFTPTLCKIMTVSILTCPLVDGTGTGWDPFSAPDFYFNIETNTGSILVAGRDYHKTDLSTFPQSWSITGGLSIPSSAFGSIYKVHIWEWDSPDSDDDVAILSFRLSDYSTYPTEFTITSGSSQVKLTVQWQ